MQDNKKGAVAAMPFAHPLFLFCLFHDLFHFIHYMFVSVFVVWLCAVHTAFDAVFQIYEITAAFVFQTVKGAITEEAVQFFCRKLMTRKIFTVFMLKKNIIIHGLILITFLFFVNICLKND